MRQTFALIFSLLCLSVSFVSVSQDTQTLTIVTYDSFAMSEEVLSQFEDEYNAELEVLRLSDAGVMVNQSILSRNNPLGDVMYGVDNTFLSRALDEDLFFAYESPLLENIPEEFQLDDQYRATPVTFGDVCLNYDVLYFVENELPLPESLEDLIDPIYEGLLVVQNPATSSPGLAFLLTTIAVFDDEGDYTFVDYWADLVDNDVLITDGWTEAYYTYFSVHGGDRPLVLSYASSPPVEMLFADPRPEDAFTGAIVSDGMCFRQIEFVGILDGTENVELAQSFVDFVIDLPFQEALPLNMFVFPVHQEAELPELFIEYTAIPENAIAVDFNELDENREDWIRAWTQVIRQ